MEELRPDLVWDRLSGRAPSLSLGAPDTEGLCQRSRQMGTGGAWGQAEVPLSGPKSPGKPSIAAAGTVHRPVGVTPGPLAHLAQELSLSVTKQHQGKAVVDAIDGPIGQECDEPTDGGEHPDGC